MKSYAVWDLETDDLDGDLGRILCASILLYPEEEMVTLRNDDISGNMEDDSEIAVKIRDLLETRQVTAGWYSKGFDIPFLNTRLAAAGERPIQRHWHLDGYYFWRGWRGLKLRNGKLKTVVEFLDCSAIDIDVERKPDVDVEQWKKAAMSSDLTLRSKAIDILADRCEADVRITDKVIDASFDLGLIKNVKTYP